MRAECHPGDIPAITHFDFRPWDGEEQGKVLARLAADYDLKRARCTTVLDPSEYSLLLTEAPDVPAEELRAAIRWRIKDLIDFHINDATLDVFELPAAAGSGGKVRQMYAVAARSEAIQRRVNLMDAAGVNLDIIDIPELAQRNIAALLPEDINGVMLLSLGAGGGLITITKQGEIYMSRNLDTGLEALELASDPAAYYDRIVLEVQRSLDYFDSHFRQAPIGHLVLTPMARPAPGLVEHLQSNLSVSVHELDLAMSVRCPMEIPTAAQARCLTTIGAALRHEEKAL